MKLAQHIVDSINSNSTSIGDNPCIPPEMEDKFLYVVVSKYFDTISKGVEDEQALRKELVELLVKCKKLEKDNKAALEELCRNSLNTLFQIPNETVNIDMKLVDRIDTKGQRLTPESTEGYSFEDIDEMKSLTDEVYKRRFLNCLISGAALYYASQVDLYLSDLFNINSELPSIYKRIMEINNILMYIDKDKFGAMDGGKVDVFLNMSDMVSTIKAEGLLFPVLFEESVKGLLELAISHGLPDKREQAEFVTMKSDFKLAEKWDQRLGLPLWEVFIQQMEKCGIKPIDMGINFVMMEVAKLSPEKFNVFFQDVLANTKSGLQMLERMGDHIQYMKDKDEFDDYMSQQMGNEYPIQDDDEYDSDDLLNDELCADLVMDCNE